jgi:hypothetical protein
VLAWLALILLEIELFSMRQPLPLKINAGRNDCHSYEKAKTKCFQLRSARIFQ